LKLERRPRGRPKGTTGSHKPSPPYILLMLRIALETGERGAEPLARLAIATGLLREPAVNASRRIAKHWRRLVAARRGGGRPVLELETIAASLGAAGARVVDSDTVVRQVGADPYWRDLIMQGDRISAPTHWLDLVIDQIGTTPLVQEEEPKK
jgi:hypothetical protein